MDGHDLVLTWNVVLTRIWQLQTMLSKKSTGSWKEVVEIHDKCKLLIKGSLDFTWAFEKLSDSLVCASKTHDCKGKQPKIKISHKYQINVNCKSVEWSDNLKAVLTLSKLGIRNEIFLFYFSTCLFAFRVKRPWEFSGPRVSLSLRITEAYYCVLCFVLQNLLYFRFFILSEVKPFSVLEATSSSVKNLSLVIFNSDFREKKTPFDAERR